jgi:hypothetical protein
MKKFLNNKGDLIPFLALFPIFFLLTISSILFGSYQMDQVEMSNIVANYHNKVILEGQLTSSEETKLMQELQDKKYDTTKIEILFEPAEVKDGNDNTYVPRYGDVTFGIVYKKPSSYYYISKVFAPSSVEEQFYVGDKFTGMSEKW